jgi:hypothetical protein
MALRTILPADELAVVRGEIRRLKERESFLNNGFLNDRFPKSGVDVVAEVKPQQRRTFLRDKLPDHILNDERYWRTDLVRHVRVAPALNAARQTVR